MKKRNKYKENPRTLEECKPGTVVKIAFGVAGDQYPTRVQVAWFWGDGSCCVAALQIGVDAQGKRLHTTFPADTPCEVSLDAKDLVY